MNTILYLLIFLSLIGLGIIIYQKIPILANLSKEEMTILGRKKGIWQRLREINYKQHWLNLMIGLEKFLRRLKIIFLKIENLLSRWICFLRIRSQIMTKKSKEWIKQKQDLSHKTKEAVSIRINKPEADSQSDVQSKEETDQLPISEFKKPIKEEQKWIDLIVENPKNITAYKFLGLLYWKQHNYFDAKASLEMAVKLGSKDKKVKEALEELKKSGMK